MAESQRRSVTAARRDGWNGGDGGERRTPFHTRSRPPEGHELPGGTSAPIVLCGRPERLVPERTDGGLRSVPRRARAIASEGPPARIGA